MFLRIHLLDFLIQPGTYKDDSTAIENYFINSLIDISTTSLIFQMYSPDDRDFTLRSQASTFVHFITLLL